MAYTPARIGRRKNQQKKCALQYVIDHTRAKICTLKTKKKKREENRFAVLFLWRTRYMHFIQRISHTCVSVCLFFIFIFFSSFLFCAIFRSRYDEKAHICISIECHSHNTSVFAYKQRTAHTTKRNNNNTYLNAIHFSIHSVIRQIVVRLYGTFKSMLLVLGFLFSKFRNTHFCCVVCSCLFEIGEFWSRQRIINK